MTSGLMHVHSYVTIIGIKNNLYSAKLCHIYNYTIMHPKKYLNATIIIISISYIDSSIPFYTISIKY